MADTTRTADALEVLAGGVAQLTSSDAWQRYLDAARTFHAYSFNNVMLILSQKPDASRIAGFHAWRKLGRHVSRGEKALWVLAPITRRKSDDAKNGDDPNQRHDRPIPIGFRAVPVWDISQTEGEELPHVSSRLLGDDPDDAFGRLREVAHGIGYTVEHADDLGGALGKCSLDTRTIRILAANSPAQRVKTLVHEIAHALLHEHEVDRARAELEAESVAFVVCADLNVDSSDYSFGYISTWAGGGDEAVAGIKESGGRIQKAAHTIFELLDSNVANAQERAA